MTEQHSTLTPAWARTGGFFSFGANDAELAGSTEDRQQLIEALHRYAMAYDERDLDVLRSVFTDGAVWQGIIQGESLPAVEGGQVIVDWLAEIMETQLDQRRHIVVNPVIESVEGDTAQVLSYILVTSATEQGVSIATSGFYDIRFVRQNGVWLIELFVAGFDVSF